MLYASQEGFDRSLFAGSSCAFGVFDGLHMGHRFLIDQAIETGVDSKSIIITFDIDPDEIFRPEQLKKLMHNDDRLESLASSGVDDVVAFHFDEALYSKLPDEFLETAFPAGAPAHLHVGEDFRFGARAAGTVEDLRAWGESVGCNIHAHSLVSADGTPITSTRIRKLLAECRLDEANQLLGHPYTLRETVQRGRGEGSGFGFATANLLVKPHDRVLGEGVYAACVTVTIGDESDKHGKCGKCEKRYKAAVSVGVSPTFESMSTANVEVHILDFEGDLVGREIAVAFNEYLRPMRRFDSTDELIAAVTADIQHVRDTLDTLDISRP